MWRFLMFLLLGALLTVFVAAASAAVPGRILTAPEYYEYPQYLTWPAAPPAHWTKQPDEWHPVRSVGRSIDEYRVRIDQPRTSGSWHMWRCEAGLPARALQGEVMIDIPPDMSNEPIRFQYRWSVPFRQRTSSGYPSAEFIVMPLRPVPLGFTANTLFYAAILWSPGAIKRWRRRRNGRCEKCAYALEGLRLCPECGRAAKTRPAET